MITKVVGGNYAVMIEDKPIWIGKSRLEAKVIEKFLSRYKVVSNGSKGWALINLDNVR